MLSNPKERAQVVRKYFIDPPDPASLAAAEGGIREAERQMAAAGDFGSIAAREKATRARLLMAPGLIFALFVVLVLVISLWESMAVILLSLPAVAALVGTVALTIRAIAVPRDQAILERQAALRAYQAAEWARARHYAAKHEYERLMARAEPKPSDADMDRILLEDVSSVRSRAMKTLALTPYDLVRPVRPGPVDELDWSPFNSSDPQDPFVVYGPAHGEGYPVSSAVGMDGKRRYGRYSVMIICTTRYHLAIYRCVLDFFTGTLDNESTAEYHYRDVVAVRTVSDPDRGQQIVVEPRESQRHLFPPGTERYFELVVSSGDRMRVATGLSRREITSVRRSGHSENFAHQGSDPDFQAVADVVRMMLREKKGGVDGPELVS